MSYIWHPYFLHIYNGNYCRHETYVFCTLHAMLMPNIHTHNFVRITELRAGTHTSSDKESETETQSKEVLLENQNMESAVDDLAL